MEERDLAFHVALSIAIAAALAFAFLLGNQVGVESCG